MTTGGGHPDTHGAIEPTTGPQTPSGVSSANDPVPSPVVPVPGVTPALILDLAKVMHDQEWLSGGYEHADAESCWNEHLPQESQAFIDQAAAVYPVIAGALRAEIAKEIADKTRQTFRYSENCQLMQYLRSFAATPTRSRRYDQCDGTCTVDCGHCKGEGPPSSTEEQDR